MGTEKKKKCILKSTESEIGRFAKYMDHHSQPTS